jgi:hypothetical protein
LEMVPMLSQSPLTEGPEEAQDANSMAGSVSAAKRKICILYHPYKNNFAYYPLIPLSK